MAASWLGNALRTKSRRSFRMRLTDGKWKACSMRKTVSHIKNRFTAGATVSFGERYEHFWRAL